MLRFPSIEFHIMDYISKSPEQTYTLGVDFAKKIKLQSKGVKVGFIGDLGAGKTLFIKGLLSELMPEITVTSPTYTLINVYNNSDDEKSTPIYHVDLYRINDPEELIMCGFYEILKEPNSIMLIEWLDRISTTIDIGNDIIIINIEAISENERRISING